MSHFNVLNVSVFADDTAIRKAFDKLSQEFHPDRFVGKSATEQKKGAESLGKVKQAYATLSNPVARQKYEEELLIAGREVVRGHRFNLRSREGFHAALLDYRRASGIEEIVRDPARTMTVEYFLIERMKDFIENTDDKRKQFNLSLIKVGQKSLPEPIQTLLLSFKYLYVEPIVANNENKEDKRKDDDDDSVHTQPKLLGRM